VFKAVEEHAGLSLREVAIKLFDIGKTTGTAADVTGDGARVVDEARSPLSRPAPERRPFPHALDGSEGAA